MPIVLSVPARKWTEPLVMGVQGAIQELAVPAIAKAGSVVKVGWWVLNMGSEFGYFEPYFSAVPVGEWKKEGVMGLGAGYAGLYEESFMMPSYNVEVKVKLMRQSAGSWILDDYKSKTVKLESEPVPPPPDTGLVYAWVQESKTGAVVSGASAALDGRTATEQQAGLYSFGEVTKGSYTLRVTATGYKEASKSVTVEAGKTNTFYVSLEKTEAATTGVVYAWVQDSSTGDTIAGATAKIDDKVGTEQQKGLYYFGEVKAGAYTITVTAAGYKNRSQPVLVEAGRTNTYYVMLEKGEGESPPTEPPTEPPEQPPETIEDTLRKVPLWGWALIIGGGAAGGIALVTGGKKK